MSGSNRSVKKMYEIHGETGDGGTVDTEDAALRKIFSDCDISSAGKAPVSMLIGYMREHISACEDGPRLLEELRKSLCTTSLGGQVTWQQFHDESRRWVAKVRQLDHQDGNNNLHNHRRDALAQHPDLGRPDSATPSESDTPLEDEDQKYCSNMTNGFEGPSVEFLDSSNMSSYSTSSVTTPRCENGLGDVAAVDRDFINCNDSLVETVELRSRIRRFGEENADLRDELIRAEECNAALQRQLDVSTRRLEQASDRCVQLEREIDEHKELLRAAEKEEDNCILSLQRMERERSLLTKQLNMAELEKRKIPVLNAELDNLTKKEREGARQLIKCRQEEEALRERNLQLEDAYTNLQESYEIALSTVTHLRERVQQLETEISELQLMQNPAFQLERLSMTSSIGGVHGFIQNKPSRVQEIQLHDSLCAELKASGFPIEAGRNDSRIQELEEEINEYKCINGEQKAKWNLYIDEIHNITTHLEKVTEGLALSGEDLEISNPSSKNEVEPGDLEEPDLRKLRYQATVLATTAVEMVKRRGTKNVSSQLCAEVTTSLRQSHQHCNIMGSQERLLLLNKKNVKEGNTSIVEVGSAPPPPMSEYCLNDLSNSPAVPISPYLDTSFLPKGRVTSVPSSRNPSYSWRLEEDDIITPIVAAIDKIIDGSTSEETTPRELQPRHNRRYTYTLPSSEINQGIGLSTPDALESPGSNATYSLDSPKFIDDLDVSKRLSDGDVFVNTIETRTRLVGEDKTYFVNDKTEFVDKRLKARAIEANSNRAAAESVDPVSVLYQSDAESNEFETKLNESDEKVDPSDPRSSHSDSELIKSESDSNSCESESNSHEEDSGSNQVQNHESGACENKQNPELHGGLIGEKESSTDRTTASFNNQQLSLHRNLISGEDKLDLTDGEKSGDFVGILELVQKDTLQKRTNVDVETLNFTLEKLSLRSSSSTSTTFEDDPANPVIPPTLSDKKSVLEDEEPIAINEPNQDPIQASLIENPCQKLINVDGKSVQEADIRSMNALQNFKNPEISVSYQDTPTCGTKTIPKRKLSVYHRSFDYSSLNTENESNWESVKRSTSSPSVPNDETKIAEAASITAMQSFLPTNVVGSSFHKSFDLSATGDSTSSNSLSPIRRVKSAEKDIDGIPKNRPNTNSGDSNIPPKNKPFGLAPAKLTVVSQPTPFEAAASNNNTEMSTKNDSVCCYEANPWMPAKFNFGTSSRNPFDIGKIDLKYQKSVSLDAECIASSKITDSLDTNKTHNGDKPNGANPFNITTSTCRKINPFNAVNSRRDFRNRNANSLDNELRICVKNDQGTIEFDKSESDTKETMEIGHRVVEGWLTFHPKNSSTLDEHSLIPQVKNFETAEDVVISRHPNLFTSNQIYSPEVDFTADPLPLEPEIQFRDPVESAVSSHIEQQSNGVEGVLKNSSIIPDNLSPLSTNSHSTTSGPEVHANEYDIIDTRDSCPPSHPQSPPPRDVAAQERRGVREHDNETAAVQRAMFSGDDAKRSSRFDRQAETSTVYLGLKTSQGSNSIGISNLFVVTTNSVDRAKGVIESGHSGVESCLTFHPKNSSTLEEHSLIPQVRNYEAAEDFVTSKHLTLSRSNHIGSLENDSTVAPLPFVSEIQFRDPVESSVSSQIRQQSNSVEGVLKNSSVILDNLSSLLTNSYSTTSGPEVDPRKYIIDTRDPHSPSHPQSALSRNVAARERRGVREHDNETVAVARAMSSGEDTSDSECSPVIVNTNRHVVPSFCVPKDAQLFGTSTAPLEDKDKDEDGDRDAQKITTPGKLRRSVSESDGSGSSHTKCRCRGSPQEVADIVKEKPAEIFPSLPDARLRELGIANVPNGTDLSENLSEDDLERKYTALSVGLATDRVTLPRRVALSLRHRDQAERNFASEVRRMHQDIQALAPLCVDRESVERVERVRHQLEMIAQCAHRVSCAAEMLGAAHQEHRVSRAALLADRYLQVLRTRCDKLAAELVETKRILTENNIVVEENAGELGDDVPKVRYRGLPTNNRTMTMSRRRASIATISRPLGTPQDIIMKDTGRPRNSVSGRMTLRRPSLTYDNQKFDEKLDRTDSSSSSIGELREIFEQAESRRSSREENNNLFRTQSSNFSVGSCESGDSDVWASPKEDSTIETAEDDVHFESRLNRRTSQVLRTVQAHVPHVPVFWWLLISFILGCTFMHVVSPIEPGQVMPINWWSWEELMDKYVQIKYKRPPPM